MEKLVQGPDEAVAAFKLRILESVSHKTVDQIKIQMKKAGFPGSIKGRKAELIGQYQDFVVSPSLVKSLVLKWAHPRPLPE